MASRTKLTLLVLATLITKSLCDSDLKNFSLEDKLDLLRGSGEEKEIIDPDLELEEKPDSEEKSELEEYTTTEAATDTTYMVTLKDESRIDTTVMPEESTTEVIDNNVVRTTVAEDIYNAGVVKAETTTTTPPPTTKAMEVVEGMSPALVELDGEPEANLRSPKVTDTRPEPKHPDRPTFEPTSPPEAVSAHATLRGWLEDPWVRAPAGLLVPLRSTALARARAVWDDLVGAGLNLTDIILIGYDSNGINWRSRHNLQSTSSKNGSKAVSDALSKLLIKYQGVHSDTNDGTMKALTSATKLVPYDSALFVLTDKGAGDPQRLPIALRYLVSKRLKVYTIWTNPALLSESDQTLQGLKNISRHTEGDVLTYTLQGMETGSNNMGTEMREPWDPQPRQARLNSIAEEEKFETLLVRKGGGDVSLGIPVEYGVTALRIHLEGAVEHAVLYPPNDAPQVDLYNTTSVQAFSPASRTEELSPREVFLVFPGADPQVDSLKVLPMKPTDSSSAMAGMWHLSVRCDTCDYRLCVSARAQLRFHVTPMKTDMRTLLRMWNEFPVEVFPGGYSMRFFKRFLKGRQRACLLASQASIGGDKVKVRVTGPVASVRESALVDEYGAELAKLPFRYQPITGDGQDAIVDSPMAELEEIVTIPELDKADRVYVKILGRDLRGEPFVRLSGPINQPEVRMGRSAVIDSVNDLERAEEANSRAYLRLQFNNDSNVLPYNRVTSQVLNQQGTILTAVQIGLSTRLYGSPGDNLQLHFEVTNYREQSVRFNFQARGELNFLRDISPTSQTVLSGQTVNVIVYVGITNTAQPGARDLITFTATGIDQVSISSYVYVVNTVDSNDVWAPELRHTFQGMCIGKLGDDCAQHTWSTTIIARDAGTGLLRLTSTPIGLVYDSNFVSGTREEIRATYRATCCAPRLSVTAVDANGNVNSYIIDISGYLNGASIAAITLGVFLIIAIIAVIIFLVYWCARRRKESRELPYSTSTRN